jgi:hypothetical protein
VPVKLPVTVLRFAMNALQYVQAEVSFHGTAALGTLWFATVFSGRGSHKLRVTRPAQSASERGTAEPTGSVPKYSPLPVGQAAVAALSSLRAEVLPVVCRRRTTGRLDGLGGR